MSKRDQHIIFEDMLECIAKIERYTKDLTFEDFMADSMCYDATIRNLEILGESANNLSELDRSQYPDIPWNQLRGLRNRIIHEYFGVDATIIWFIIEHELLKLKIEIEKASRKQ